VKKRDSARACRLLREHILGAGRVLGDFLAAERAGPTAASKATS
jgi:hypothetical protein